jgi:hypothetical protein
VFLLRIVAAKNSINRRAACSPAPAIAAGTASELRSDDALTGVAASTTAGKLRRSALTATPYKSTRTPASDPPARTGLV